MGRRDVCEVPPVVERSVGIIRRCRRTEDLPQRRPSGLGPSVVTGEGKSKDTGEWYGSTGVRKLQRAHDGAIRHAVHERRGKVHLALETAGHDDELRPVAGIVLLHDDVQCAAEVAWTGAAVEGIRTRRLDGPR